MPTVGAYAYVLIPVALSNLRALRHQACQPLSGNYKLRIALCIALPLSGSLYSKKRLPHPKFWTHNSLFQYFSSLAIRNYSAITARISYCAAYIAAYTAKSSLMAKRHMPDKRQTSLQASLLRIFVLLNRMAE